MIEICAIGGYNEFGKNMTAVRVDDEVVILDMGLHLESYIRFTEDEDKFKLAVKDLVNVGAVPDDSVIKDWKDKVKLIIPTHAHLDHVGALPFISNKYNAPILCTPFTKEVIEAIVRDDKLNLKNQVKPMAHNSKYKLRNITVEFINMTHSTPQTVMVALHTKYGTVLYANDFKFDYFPVLGKKADISKLKQLKNVIALICDCTRAKENVKTPSESVARQMLKDVLLSVNSDGKAIIVTTFSSHLARIKSIIEYGKKINRKIILLGRSLSKYVRAGENIEIVNFSKDAEIVGFSKRIKKKLRDIEHDKEKYLLVVTGHQGEPRSVLTRIANGDFKFKLGYEDIVIYSCTIIPQPINLENREKQEQLLKDKHVRIFKDIHVSGHASKEDIRDLINITKPAYIIPAHGDQDMKKALKDLASEMGYKDDKILMICDGSRVTFS